MTASILRLIRDTRIRKGYSQEYLGIKIGASQNVIHKIETGKMEITVDQLIKIALILELNLMELFSDSRI